MTKSREAFRTISEVASWLDVQTHVLRFWESKFSQVKPVKRAGGRRYYRPQDMELLGGIKKLLHEDGMAIKDAQKLLKEMGVKHVSSLSQPVDQDAQPAELQEDSLPSQAESSAEDRPDKVIASDNAVETSVNIDEQTALPTGDETSSEANAEQATSAEQESSNDIEIEDQPVQTQSPIDNGRGLNAADPEGLVAASDQSHDEMPSREVAQSSIDQPLGNESPNEEPADVYSAKQPGQSDATEAMGDLFSSLRAENASIKTASPTAPLEPQKETFTASAGPTEHTSSSSDDTQREPATTSSQHMPTESHEHESAEVLGNEAITAGETAVSAKSMAPNDALPSKPDSIGAPVTQQKNLLSPAPAHLSSVNDTTEESPNEHETGVSLEIPSDDTASSVEAQANNVEDSKDAFLRIFSKDVGVAPKDRDRVATLLARLEALHNRVS